MNQTQDNKLQRALAECYLLQLEASRPEKLIFLDLAVRLAQRTEAPPPDWLYREMLKAPGLSQLFLKHENHKSLELKARIKRRNRLAYLIAEAFDTYKTVAKIRKQKIAKAPLKIRKLHKRKETCGLWIRQVQIRKQAING